jgi:hypothetical protein
MIALIFAVIRSQVASNGGKGGTWHGIQVSTNMYLLRYNLTVQCGFNLHAFLGVKLACVHHYDVVRYLSACLNFALAIKQASLAMYICRPGQLARDYAIPGTYSRNLYPKMVELLMYVKEFQVFSSMILYV